MDQHALSDLFFPGATVGVADGTGSPLTRAVDQGFGSFYFKGQPLQCDEENGGAGATTRP